MNHVCFVYRYADIPSAQVRAFQVAEALGAGLLPLSELTPDVASRYRALVYVKEVPDRATLAGVRDRGVRQVWDPIDRYDWRALGRSARWIDAFIAANHTHAVLLERRFDRPATVIPHHHCNFDEVRIPEGREPPTLGFIGGRDHWPASRRLVRKLPYRVFSMIHTLGPLAEAYLDVDVGFAYRVDGDKLSYNAATKLVNFMSFGIPSVLTPETGYLEVARHAEACLYAQSKKEFVMLVDELASDRAMRRRLGEAGFEAAKAYHIRVVAEQYRAFLEGLA